MTKVSADIRALEDELLARVAAQQSLESWIQYRQDGGLKPALHHKLIINELEKVERGETRRLMLILPPGSAKSTYSSMEFPPWYLGRNPGKLIIGASNVADLAVRFGRKARNIVGSKEFKAVFEDSLSSDAAASDDWETVRGSEYKAVGVGGTIAGRRGDLGLIDDPVKSKEAAESERERNKMWDWYVNDFETRLKPDSRQILIQCMTGDTQVLMADGRQKALRDLKQYDFVATYDNGQLKTTYVRDVWSQGKDDIYEIKTRLGGSLKANARHPFLVSSEEGVSWKPLKNLLPGDLLVKVRNGATGKASNAPSMDASLTQNPEVSVTPTTTKQDGLQAFGLHRSILKIIAKLTSSIATALRKTNTTGFLPSNLAYALSANASLTKKVLNTGSKNSVSTIATTQAKSEDYSATTATYLLDEPDQPKFSNQPRNTCDFTLDPIVGILPAGREEVFDVQIARTENFIANGYASHNTRWHELDLAGQILNRDGDMWRVIRVPMEADSPDDPLGRQIGERLWPEWFTDEMVTQAKKDVRTWNALYQGNPVPEQGNYFQKDWFVEYDPGDQPSTLYIYGASDYAVTEGKGDYTEHGVFGVDWDGDVWVLDWWYGQTEPDKWIESQCDLILKYSPITWFGESGPIRRATEPSLKKRMESRKAYCHLEWLPSIHEKTARARGAQSMASMGKIKIPKSKPWLNHVLTHWLQFPAGRQDDAVDVLSLIGRGLEFVQSAGQPRKRGTDRLTNANAWLG